MRVRACYLFVFFFQIEASWELESTVCVCVYRQRSVLVREVCFPRNSTGVYFVGLAVLFLGEE